MLANGTFDKAKFFRRRQFVLGPEYIDYEGWKKTVVDDGLLLTVHPDLPTTVFEADGNKAVLLGYAIDPYQPELENEDILAHLVESGVSLGDVTTSLERLSGRYVLILKSHESFWLFHDACALRQVHYCRDLKGRIWCASQAESLAERLGFTVDEEVVNYRDFPLFQSGKDEYWALNDRTPYREIKYLLSNHYLDLRQGKVLRYWPVAGCIGSLSVNESIQHVRTILQNSVRAAALRFDLKMGISAGCDSRRSLAAARDVKERIYFFTHTPLDMMDMEIPSRLLPKLSIEHHKLELRQMSPEFRSHYERSATWPREKHGHIAFTALEHFGPEATVLNSNISEYSQVWYWLPKSKITGEGLALAKSLNLPFAIGEFQKWIDGARSACDIAKMNILVLFDLELRARWVTAAVNEYDIAYETFIPYNNRRLFDLELSVNERLRRGRRWDFPIKQIKSMWPEVLSEPINPEHRTLGRIRQFFLRSIINRTITPWLPVIEYLRYHRLARLYKQQAEWDLTTGRTAATGGT